MKVCILCLSAVSFFLRSQVQGVEVIDNGYEKILVALPKGLGDDEYLTIITNLESILKNTSKALHRATNGIYFKTVTFLLTKGITGVNSSDATWELLAKPDFRVDVSTATEEFSALQSRGCARPGEYISIPKNKALNNSNPDIDFRILLRQWAQYRYGVFEELPVDHGEATTHCYKDDSGWKPTGCYSPQISVDLQPREDFSGVQGCSASYVDPQKLFGKSNISSSLLYAPTLPQVEYFCNDTTHMFAAPTRHNLLCNEASTWDVISRSPDFLHRSPRSATEYQEVQFNYVKPVSHTYVYVIQTVIKNEDKYKNIYREIFNSFRRFLKFHAPESLEGVIIEMKDNSQSPQKVVFNGKPSEREKIIPIPFSVSPGNLSSQGINETLQNIKNATENVSTPVTLTIVSTTKTFNDLIPLLKESINLSKLRLCAVLNEVNTRNEMLSQVNQVYVVPNFATDTYRSSSFADIAWHDIHRLSRLLYGETLVLYQKRIDLKTGLNDNFLTDIRNGRVSISYSLSNSEGVKDQFESVCNMDGMSMKDVVEKKETQSEDLLMRNISCFIGDKAGTETSFLLVSVRSPTASDNYTKLTGWFDNYEADKETPQTPKLIFAEVKPNKDIKDIKADIILPEGNQNRSFTLSLKDDGYGEPDVTKNDGIYSGFFLNFISEGWYSVVITAAINTERGLAYRKQFIGSFWSKVRNSDIPFPPRRVSDLRLRSLTQSNVMIEWTAPGSEFDHGTASAYEIMHAKDRKTLLTNPSFVSTVKNPETANTLEQVEFSHPKDNWDYYLAIKARNGKTASKLSNIIHVLVLKETTTQQTTLASTQFFENTSSATTLSPDPDTTTDVNLSTTPSPNNDELIYIIAGSCGGVLLLVIIINIIVCFFCFRRRKAETEKDVEKRTVTITPRLNTDQANNYNSDRHSVGDQSISHVNEAFNRNDENDESDNFHYENIDERRPSHKQETNITYHNYSTHSNGQTPDDFDSDFEDSSSTFDRSDPQEYRSHNVRSPHEHNRENVSVPLRVTPTPSTESLYAPKAVPRQGFPRTVPNVRPPPPKGNNNFIDLRTVQNSPNRFPGHQNNYAPGETMSGSDKLNGLYSFPNKSKPNMPNVQRRFPVEKRTNQPPLYMDAILARMKAAEQSPSSSAETLPITSSSTESIPASGPSPIYRPNPSHAPRGASGESYDLGVV